jgi:hypothetical protein
MKFHLSYAEADDHEVEADDIEAAIGYAVIKYLRDRMTMRTTMPMILRVEIPDDQSTAHAYVYNVTDDVVLASLLDSRAFEDQGGVMFADA